MNKAQVDLSNATVKTIGQIADAIKTIGISINVLQKSVIMLKERLDKLDERSSN
jgi:hypothetical protein